MILTRATGVRSRQPVTTRVFWCNTAQAQKTRLQLCTVALHWDRQHINAKKKWDLTGSTTWESSRTPRPSFGPAVLRSLPFCAIYLHLRGHCLIIKSNTSGKVPLPAAGFFLLEESSANGHLFFTCLEAFQFGELITRAKRLALCLKVCFLSKYPKFACDYLILKSLPKNAFPCSLFR
jgi:hypothetical protein